MKLFQGSTETSLEYTRSRKIIEFVNELEGCTSTYTKNSLSKKKVTELITSKFKKIPELTNVTASVKAIDSVVKYTVIRVNKINKELDQRNISNDIYRQNAILESLHISPEKIQEDAPDKQGITKPNKIIRDYYHDAQRELFNRIHIKCDDVGYVTGKDGQRLSTLQFCNRIDKYSLTYVPTNSPDSPNVKSGNEGSITTTTRSREETLKIVRLVLDILCCRIYSEFAIPNNIHTYVGWKQWTEHIQVIASFATLLTILEIEGIQLGGSYLDQH